MRSVADIPPGDDAGDELSGISPELVLVDPELARLVRERETSPGVPALPPPRRTPALRLVPAPAVEPGIVPRPAASAPPPTASAPPPPAASAAAPSVTTAPDVDESVVDAEPARSVEPPRHPIPAPLAEPARSWTVTPSPAYEGPVAQAMLAPTTETVMPHPVKRTSSARRPERAPRPTGRGRRVLALLAGVAAASVAVFALLQLTGGTSEPSRTVAGPQAKSPVSGPRHAAPEPKPTSKPAATPPRSKTEAKATSNEKPSAAAKPRAAAPKTAARPAAKPQAAAPQAAAKPAAKPAPKPEQAAAVAPAAGPASPAGNSGAPAATRRFAWAPVEGAVGYHVELFRGAERVLVQETKEPVLELGQTWRYHGRTLTLTPGEYRWYVWPVTKSGRATQAVVQAKLTV